MQDKNREALFHPGDTVRHFKRDTLTNNQLAKEPHQYLYEIVGIAEQTETGERLMVYRALYGSDKLYARPLEQFLSEVDLQKYPNAVQKHRFERFTGAL